MNDCLIISCVQEDIVNSCNEGPNIVLAINEFIEKNKQLKIILINDWHNKNNKIFEKEEIHCIKGTFGAKTYKGLNVIENQCKIIFKGMNEDSKNAFFEDYKTPSKLENYLNEINVEKIFICGFEVEETVKTALEKSYNIEIIEQATFVVEKKKKKKKEENLIEEKENSDIIEENVENVENVENKQDE